VSNRKGTAVVTGATGGLGALYAAGLAERGYDLLLSGRKRTTLDAVAKAAKQRADVKVDTLVANLAEAEDLARVEARISSDPAITALVNNAGAASFGQFAKLSSEALDETTAVNIIALTRPDPRSVTRLTGARRGFNRQCRIRAGLPSVAGVRRL